MSGIDKLLDLLDKDIPECKKRLQESHINLEDVALYCEGNYAKATDKRKALEETKGYMTQSLASVAYQINLMSTNFLQLLDLQVDQVTEMESSINHLSQVVSIHKEKVARREIGELTQSKNYYRPPGLKANGVVIPEKIEQTVAYVRKPIDFDALDNLGISRKPATASQTLPPPAQRKSSVSNRDSGASLNHSVSTRSSISKPAVAVKRPDARPPNPLTIPEPPSSLHGLPPPPPPPELMSPGLPPPPMTPLSPPGRAVVPDSPALPPPPLGSDESLAEDPGPVDDDLPEAFSARMSQMILDDATWIPADFVEKVVAVYSYAQDKEDELSFSEGAVIYVIQKNDDGWWEGVMDGQSGLFPSNYVEPCI